MALTCASLQYGPEQADGLVHSRASRLEALAERVVFRFLPAHADTEAHPSARQGVERADLLGDEGRLALWQHQHLGTEGDTRGDGGHVGERRQGLENRHRGIVRAGGPPLHGDAHHHMVEDVDVIEADPLDGGGEAADRSRPFAVTDARELDGQFQGCLLRSDLLLPGRAPSSNGLRPCKRYTFGGVTPARYAIIAPGSPRIAAGGGLRAAHGRGTEVA